MIQQSFQSLEEAQFCFSRKNFNKTVYLVYAEEDKKFMILSEKRLKFLKNYWHLNIEVIEKYQPSKDKIKC